MRALSAPRTLKTSIVSRVSLGAGEHPDQALLGAGHRPAGAGNRGQSFVPEVGDEVLIAFRSGDPRLPVILGGLWKGDNPPPEKLGLPVRQATCSAITGSSGTKIAIVEDPSGPTIQITTSTGSAPAADTVQVAIHIGGSGIEISAPASQVMVAAGRKRNYHRAPTQRQCRHVNLQRRRQVRHSECQFRGCCELLARGRKHLVGARVQIAVSVENRRDERPFITERICNKERWFPRPRSRDLGNHGPAHNPGRVDPG